MCWESLHDKKAVMDTPQLCRRGRLGRHGKGVSFCAQGQYRFAIGWETTLLRVHGLGSGKILLKVMSWGKSVTDSLIKVMYQEKAIKNLKYVCHRPLFTREALASQIFAGNATWQDTRNHEGGCQGITVTSQVYRGWMKEPKMIQTWICYSLNKKENSRGYDSLWYLGSTLGSW